LSQIENGCQQRHLVSSFLLTADGISFDQPTTSQATVLARKWHFLTFVKTNAIANKKTGKILRLKWNSRLTIGDKRTINVT